MSKPVSLFQKALIGYLGCLLLATAVLPHFVEAFEITTATVEEKNDFVLEPGKIELFLNPGETATRAVSVTSRINKKTRFKVEVEDFVGSRDEKNPVVLLGDEKSPYSIKDSIVPDTKEFTLDFGQRITIPVTFSVPINAQPGGFYASVLVSNIPEDTVDAQTGGRARIVSRLGALAFVRVNGNANEQGHLEDFRISGPSKFIYDHGPFTYQILFNNDGNVHLVPYGTVSIKNIFGKEVGSLPVDAYFSLPDSTRYREVSWNPGFLFGRYKAYLELNRGYGGVSDQKIITFWVLPWKILLAVFVALFIIVSMGVYISKHFELRKK